MPDNRGQTTNWIVWAVGAIVVLLLLGWLLGWFGGAETTTETAPAATEAPAATAEEPAAPAEEPAAPAEGAEPEAPAN